MSIRPKNGLVFTLLLATSSCIVSPDAEVGLRGEASVASAYNHRGMTMNERGVAQAIGAVNLPTKWRDGELDLIAFGNVDLQDDTGDAWFPDGHSGKLTEIDLTAAYSEQVGDFWVTGGFTSYVLPNGTEFVFSPALSERGETKEIFARAETELGGFTPFGILHIDVDEANGFYLRFGAGKSYVFKDNVFADFELAAAVNDDNHAEWTYGVPDGGAGLADLRFTARANYQHNDQTLIFGQLGFSQILGSDIEDWMDDIGIDTTGIWVALGTTWSL